MMDIIFRRGYVVYRDRRDKDYMYVAPHSGPALEIPTSRDDNSETVASLCWLRTGGSLVLSTMPRKRAFGIDFNRGIPKKSDALELFPGFLKDERPARLNSFRNRYAWTAFNEDDYKKRYNIYHSFWNEVRSGKTIALIHAAFNRLKLVPSVIDITTFDSRGVDKRLLREIVDDINTEYEQFFGEIERSFKAVVLLEEERAINNILRVTETFGMDRMNPDSLENIRSDLDAIKAYTNKDEMKGLEENFTPSNFLKASQKALSNMEAPRITIEHFFKGIKSVAPRKQLLGKAGSGKIVMNFECSRFINFWYPHMAAEIITKIIDRVRELHGG